MPIWRVDLAPISNVVTEVYLLNKIAVITLFSIVSVLSSAVLASGAPFATSGPAVKCTVSCKTASGSQLKCSAYGASAACRVPMGRNAVICSDKEKTMVCDCVGNPDPGCAFQPTVR